MFRRNQKYDQELEVFLRQVERLCIASLIKWQTACPIFLFKLSLQPCCGVTRFERLPPAGIWSPCQSSIVCPEQSRQKGEEMREQVDRPGEDFVEESEWREKYAQ